MDVKYQKFVENRIKILEEESLHSPKRAKNVNLFSKNLQQEIIDLFQGDKIQSLMKLDFKEWKQIVFIYQSWLLRLKKVELNSLSVVNSSQALSLQGTFISEPNALLIESEMRERYLNFSDILKDIKKGYNGIREEIADLLHKSLPTGGSLPEEKSLYPVILKAHCLLLDIEKDLNLIHEKVSFDLSHLKASLEALHIDTLETLKKAVEINYTDEISEEKFMNEQPATIIKMLSNSILYRYNTMRSSLVEERLKARAAHFKKNNTIVLKKARIVELKKKLERLKDRNRVTKEQIDESKRKMEEFPSVSIPKSILAQKNKTLLDLRRKMIRLTFFAMDADVKKGRSVLLYKEFLNDQAKISFINIILIILKAFKLYGKVDKSSGRNFQYVTSSFNRDSLVIQLKREVEAVLSEISRPTSSSSELFTEVMRRLIFVVKDTKFICLSYPLSTEYIT